MQTGRLLEVCRDLLRSMLTIHSSLLQCLWLQWRTLSSICSPSPAVDGSRRADQRSRVLPLASSPGVRGVGQDRQIVGCLRGKGEHRDPPLYLRWSVEFGVVSVSYRGGREGSLGAPPQVRTPPPTNFEKCNVKITINEVRTCKEGCREYEWMLCPISGCLFSKRILGGMSSPFS